MVPVGPGRFAHQQKGNGASRDGEHHAGDRGKGAFDVTVQQGDLDPGHPRESTFDLEQVCALLVPPQECAIMV